MVNYLDLHTVFCVHQTPSVPWFSQ